MFTFTHSSALHSSIYSHASAIYTLLSPALGPTPSPLLCPTSPSTNEGEISSISSRLAPTIKGLCGADQHIFPERKLLTSLLLQSTPRSSSSGLSGRDSDPGGGDGGLFFMLFTCRLIMLAMDHHRNAPASANSADHLLSLSAGIKQGSEIAIAFLLDERCPVVFPLFPTVSDGTSSGSLRPLLSLLRASIAPKARTASLRISGADVGDYFPSCLPSNCLAAADDDDDDPRTPPLPTGLSPAALSRSILRAHLSSSLSFDPPFIKSHAVAASPFVGGPSEGALTHTTSCINLPATLLLDETYSPLPGHRPRPVSSSGDVAAAFLFACSLDPSSDDDLNRGGAPNSVFVEACYAAPSTSSSCEVHDPSSYRTSRLSRLCALLPPALLQVGATLVLCQRVVHPLIASSLASAGIRVVQRLGIRHVGPLAKLLTRDAADCGPSVVQDVESFLRSPKAFTPTRVLLSRHLGDAGLLSLSPYPASSCPAFPSTLVLSGRDPSSLEELTTLTKGCLDTLRRCESSASADPTAGGIGLAGGGCWEKAAAKAIFRHLAAECLPDTESVSERRHRSLQRAGLTMVGEALLAASLNSMRGSTRSDAPFSAPEKKWPQPATTPSYSSHYSPPPPPPTSGYSGRHGHAFITPKRTPSRLLHLFYGWSSSPPRPGSAVAERISNCDAADDGDNSDSEIVDEGGVDFLGVRQRKKVALEKSGRRLILAYYGEATGKPEYPAVFERQWAADKEQEYFGDEGGFLLDCRDTRIRAIRNAVEIATTMLSLGGSVIM